MVKNKKAFTLVELLAVIVILAVILVIAVPSIMDTIKESRKGALASSAKLIASSAESAKLSNDTLGIDTNIECSDVAQLTTDDYSSCSIKFVDGKAQVTLVGKGKFEGMGVFLGTKDNAVATEGLITDDTDDHNIRYAGGSPKNYISFNNELWRIIGTFNVTTSSGNTEKLMKIVRNEQFSTGMSWDSSTGNNNGTHEDGEVNDGLGVNQWGASTYTNGSAYEGADLMTMLNTYYIGTNTTCNYCNNSNQGTCTNDCTSSVNQIDSAYRNMIEEVVWNTGAITNASSIERSSAYTQERVSEIGANGAGTGKICTSGTYCNDTVTRTITWTGKVGLIYPSDYGYASASGTDIRNSAIGTTNWLNTGSYYWTLSPVADSVGAFFASRVVPGGVGRSNASNWFGVRPAIYLKSDVFITSGDGSEGDPYQISMN